MWDKKIIRRRFNQRAAQAGAVAEVTAEPARRLWARLGDINLSPAVVIDVGGNGSFMRQCYPAAQVIGADIAEARAPTVCCDAEQLPFADGIADVVWSAFCWEWVDSQKFCRSVARILKPGGLFAFIALGTDTLRELRQIAPDCVHTFPDMHDIGDGLLQNGFAEPVVETDTFTLNYATSAAALADLKKLGIGCLTANTPRTLTGKSKHPTRLMQHPTTVTYEVIYATAWCPTQTQTSPPESKIHFHP